MEELWDEEDKKKKYITKEKKEKRVRQNAHRKQIDKEHTDRFVP